MLRIYFFMYDLISIGDAGIDTLVEIHDANIHCSLNKDDCQLCFRYADKILVEGIVSKTAYNGMNVAVGTQRLGLKTVLVATVGGDHGGQRILNVLKREGVVAKYVKEEKKLKSNASVVLDFRGERTILVYHEDYHYRWLRLPSTHWFYVTTMGRHYWPIYDAIARRVQRTREKIGFNPGSFQLKAGAKKLKPVFKITTALFLNKEEARLLTHNHDEDDIKDLLRAMLKLGPKIAVLTDGAKGSFATDGTKFYHSPVFPTKMIERTGAGDSFAAAFVAALCYGYDIKEALRWGSVNSSAVIEKIGPQDGLLTLNVLKSILKKHPRFQPRTI